jgi:FkbM family methyltransferase
MQYIARIKKYGGVKGLDKIIEIECRSDIGPNKYYIEVGANDGIRQSNTLFLEKKYGMTGLLIEPSPPRFLDLIKNRSNQNRFYCAALVSFDYQDDFVPMIYADLMSISKLEESDDRPGFDRHLKRSEKHLRKGEVQFEFAAKAMTLTEALDGARAPKQIEIFSLDVEGSELNVLKGVDFNKYCMNNMVIETRDIDNVRNYLAKFGMKLHMKISGHDYIFKRVDPDT